MNQTLHRLSMGVSALTLMAAASSALAQQSQDNGAVEEIVVTGTAIRGVAPVGSATVSITRDTIVQSGIRDPGSLISQLPQGSGAGANLNNTGGRTAGVNLRGLGNSATLLLFDGHRTVTQGTQTILPDPNVIPFGMIERVEVVTDGASAVYGSDAVAGVVNYIFRRPFDGAEISARYTGTLYDEFAVNAVGGKTWNGGGVVIAGGFEHNSPAFTRDVPRLRLDLRQWGGADNRFTANSITAAGLTPSVLANNRLYGLPANLNGRVPTAAEVLPLLNRPDVVERGDVEHFYAERKRVSLVGRVAQDFGNLGAITLTAMYNRRTNTVPADGNGTLQSIGLTVRPTSPYYIQGLGPGNQTLFYNYRLNNRDKPLTRDDFEDTGNIFFDYKLPLFGDFRLTATGGFGVTVGCRVCQPQGNGFWTASILDTAANGFNPYVPGPQAASDRIVGFFIQQGRGEITNFGAKVDGSLFELPGGPVRIAVGGDFNDYGYRQHSLQAVTESGRIDTARYADSTRQVTSGYGEVFAPLFSSANAVTGFQRLDLSLAVRYDHYSDFGNTTNPKVGLTWVPFDDLTLRGSWGTSFRAPTLSETNFNVTGQATRTLVANGLNDPSIPITQPATRQSLVLISSLRFAQLKPETAKIYSIGGDYSPSYIRGLRLSATYYSVDYKDRISGLPNANNALSSPAIYEVYKPFFTPAPQPASCRSGGANAPFAPEYATYNPLYQKYLNEPRALYFGATTNDCQLVGILNSATQNLGRVKQSGLDLSASYRVDTPIGELGLNGAMTKILKLKRSIVPNTPLLDAKDVIGEQISNRGRVAASLRNGGLTLIIAANYLGGYLNNQTPTIAGVKLPDMHVHSWTTYDFNLSYQFQDVRGPAAGAEISFGVRNFTDRDPPLVLSGTSSVDLDNHDVWGARYTVEISKKF